MPAPNNTYLTALANVSAPNPTPTPCPYGSVPVAGGCALPGNAAGPEVVPVPSLSPLGLGLLAVLVVVVGLGLSHGRR